MILVHKGRKLFTELPNGSEEKAFDCADGDVQDFCGFIQFEAIVMAHDKDGSLLGRNFLESLGDTMLNLGRFCALYGVKIVRAAG